MQIYPPTPLAPLRGLVRWVLLSIKKQVFSMLVAAFRQ
jgi:hypothetical protein